jgi:hypothetical protein
MQKPVRIFYISDFDPSGDNMPIQVARQLEFWRSTYAPESDIKLTPLALTAAQALHYNLPRIPIKDSDLSKAKFEAEYGVGATELDALEALYPGDLNGWFVKLWPHIATIRSKPNCGTRGQRVMPSRKTNGISARLVFARSFLRSRTVCER